MSRRLQQLCYAPPNDITKESRDGGTFYMRDRGLVGTLYSATQHGKPRCIDALNM